MRDKYLQGNTTGNTVVDAGLPNITGTFGTVESYSYKPGTTTLQWEYSGAFYPKKSNVITGNDPNNGTADYDLFEFDASKCSAVYGKSTTVTPPSVTVRYYIRAE